MSRPLVIQAEDLSPPAVEFLRQHCELLACPAHDPRFASALREARGLVVRTYTRVDAGMLDAAPNLKVVGRAGVGLDNIDLDACRARGVTVVSTPNANTQAVAEYVFATHVTQTETQFIGLALTAVAKAALICYYFMHIYRLWRAEEAH